MLGGEHLEQELTPEPVFRPAAGSFLLHGALAGSLVLAPGSAVYAAFAAARVFGYAVAAFVIGTGAGVRGIWKSGPFFVLVNVSILNAWVHVLCGRGATTCQPSRRNWNMAGYRDLGFSQEAAACTARWRYRLCETYLSGSPAGSHSAGSRR